METLVKKCLLNEALVHFSNEASNEKFLLVGLQWANYKLYDTEIATIETLIQAPPAEEFFSTGNLRVGTYVKNHFLHLKVGYSWKLCSWVSENII